MCGTQLGFIVGCNVYCHLNPTPYTLNPKPYTLNPKRYTLNAAGHRRLQRLLPPKPTP